MGHTSSKPETIAGLQARFESALCRSDLDLNMPIRITGGGEKPVGDEAELHRKLKEFMRSRNRFDGIYLDRCTVRTVDYDALREEVLRTACLPCDVWFYKPPYDWVAEIRLRRAYVLAHKAYVEQNL